jgi:hypothetical protein
MRLEQFLDRTAALDRAKAKAKAMRVEQARKMGLRARALSEVTMRQPPKASAIIDWGLPMLLEVLTVSAHFVPLALSAQEHKTKRAGAERKQYAALHSSLQAFRSESSLGFSKPMDDSALNRTLEDQQSFCDKLGGCAWLGRFVMMGHLGVRAGSIGSQWVQTPRHGDPITPCTTCERDMAAHMMRAVPRWGPAELS